MIKKFLPVLSLLLLTACQDDPLAQVPKMDVPTELLTDRLAQQAGAQMFGRHCRECHGTTKEGRSRRASALNPPAPNFYEPKYAALDPSYLFWRIRDGKSVEPFFSQGSVMPVFGPHFSDEQIWQLVAYLRYRAGAMAPGLEE